MLKLDDSIFEYALYDVLHALNAEAANPVTLDSLRAQWRMTGLRHSDLYLSLELLTTAESLVPVADDAWALTDVGAERMTRVASVSSPTMADQVARSVLQLIKERVPAAARAPRPIVSRRRAVMRVRVRDRG